LGIGGLDAWRRGRFYGFGTGVGLFDRGRICGLVIGKVLGKRGGNRLRSRSRSRSRRSLRFCFFGGKGNECGRTQRALLLEGVDELARVGDTIAGIDAKSVGEDLLDLIGDVYAQGTRRGATSRVIDFASEGVSVGFLGEGMACQ
jgi:hypothetical protein